MWREKLKTLLVPRFHPNAQQLPKEICKHLHLGAFDRMFEFFELGTVYITTADSLIGEISIDGQLFKFVRFSVNGDRWFEISGQTFSEWEFLDFLFVQLPPERQNRLLDAYYKPFRSNLHNLTSFRWELEKQMRRSMTKLFLDHSAVRDVTVLDSDEEFTYFQFRLTDQPFALAIVKHTKNDSFFHFLEDGPFDFFDDLITPVEQSLAPHYPGIYFYDLFFHNRTIFNSLLTYHVISVFQKDRRRALRATFDPTIRLHPNFHFDVFIPDYWTKS